MKLILTAGAVLLGAASGMNQNGEYLKSVKQQQWHAYASNAAAVRASFPSTSGQPAACTNGAVDISGTSFPCHNIDFEGFVSLDDMKISSATSAGADIWGWQDANGREITIMCVDNGVWFIDGTDPTNPKTLAHLPARSRSSWCDVKVYKDVAYVVKDGAYPTNGIQVFDLNRLNSITGFEPGTRSYRFREDFFYKEHGNSHNLLIDNDSGFLYSVGSNTCAGGLHMVNLEPNPLKPVFAGCVSDDGYTHDAQCVVYDGPDSRYSGKELCFAFNEDTLTIWNMEDKQNVQMIARTPYVNAQYSHQGWLTEDMNYLLLDDELDEERSATDKKTRTMIVNIQDLENPTFEKRIVHKETSIDHNLYFWGAIHAKGWAGNAPMAEPPLSKYAYLSNYVAGLKVVEFSTDTLTPKLAGFFDVAPEFDTAEFHGTWSHYMHPSGVVAVSSIERGLFFLRPRMVFSEVEAVEMETESMEAILGGGN